MDTWSDVTGVLVVVTMIWVGWLLARAAWRELPSRSGETVVDLRAVESRRT